MVYSNYIPLCPITFPLYQHKIRGFTIMSPIMVVYNKGFPDYTITLYVCIYIYPVA